MTKWLIGADGARSVVARSLGFKFISKPGGIHACNVLFRADLSNHMLQEERQAALSWVVNPEHKTFPGLVGHLRVVRPWNEWVMAAFGPGGSNPFDGLTLDDPRITACIREMVGDESIDVKLLAMDPWTVREVIAEDYKRPDMNAFILGDAAHRHPPTYGLGSNTCVQDAYNLAWKIAFVSRGLASPDLLRTYSAERQPVGAELVRESNQQLRANSLIWKSMGIGMPPYDDGVTVLTALAEGSERGLQQREQLYDVLEMKRQELESLGLAYNQVYASAAIYMDDEASPLPPIQGDPIVEVRISTYPGCRVPHAWLDIATRGKLRSTQDLCGKGAFCLLLGVGGNMWRSAAEKIQETTGIPINVYGIGFGEDYQDVYRDWQKLRGVDEDGCVLVRPDRFVAWRSVAASQNPEAKLKQVFSKILCRPELAG